MEATTELVRYNFSQAELVELAREQSRHFGSRSTAEDELASIKSDYKSRLTKIEEDINRCTQRVSSGYEMRKVRCITLKARPDNVSLLIVRTDNGRVLKLRKMTADEGQLTITDAAPEAFEFECDFYEDTDSDMATEIAKDVPLTAKEAKELKDVVAMRPIAKKITDGKE